MLQINLFFSNHSASLSPPFPASVPNSEKCPLPQKFPRLFGKNGRHLGFPAVKSLLRPLKLFYHSPAGAQGPFFLTTANFTDLLV
jgi:hypothetical protein